MDILGMLQNDMDELCEEDIDMIEQELAVGTYTEEYRSQCRLHILQVTHHFEQKKKEKVYQGTQAKGLSTRLFKQEKDVTVAVATKTDEIAVEEKKHEKTQAEIFREELKKMREMSQPAKRFTDYLDDNDFMTNDFIDQNFSEFNENERSILLRKRAFTEDFLDKYFAVLDKGTLVMNQLFTEEFFMKHYNNMPVKLVLTKSKNSWRTKTKRSKKLDTFLRLKGVKI